MASPFTIFRRHQKVMIAALTLLAMFAFVVLDPLLDHIGGGASSDPVVVTTRAYGDLNETDLQSLIRQRQLVLNVMEQVLLNGGMHPAIVRYWVEQGFGPPTEESVVQTWLFAQRAEGLGMVVDDRAVNDFLALMLEQLTESRVTVDAIRESLARDKVPHRVFFSAMRNELLARQFSGSFQLSFGGVPPMQRWDYYQRLNRRADIELVPVSVTEFMDQVEDPGDGSLQAFFEKHKETEWRPDSPEPAFRQPARIALQYFRADLDDFVKTDAITDEEVQEYYEENKDSRYLQPAVSEPAAEEPSSPTKPADEAAPAADQPAAPAESAPAPAVEEPQPGEGDASMDGGQPTAESPTEEAPAKEAPAKEAEGPAGESDSPMAEPAEASDEADAPATPQSMDGAALRPAPRADRFRLTAFREEDEDAPAKSEAPADENGPSPDAKMAEPAPAEPAAQPAAEPKQEQAKQEQAKQEHPAAAASQPEGEPAGAMAEQPASPEPSTLDGRPVGASRYVP
ncbi:MAG: hypothetical protein U1E05_07765, partial [Patescibacteria group bacterium]|nr:hypothetical protein [Patescibacteria group bacterium]